MILEKKGFLFDLDGTLVDTTRMIVVCFQELMRHFYAKELDEKAIRRYIGLPYRTQLEKYTGVLDDERFNEIVTYHKAHQKSIAHDSIKLCKGARVLLEKLAEKNRVMGIVTSRLIDSTADYLQFLKIEHFFQTIVTPAETEFHKPHPQPLQKAMELLNLQPEETVYIGDSRFDMEAANRAKVTSIYTAWDKKDFPFSSAKPDFIVSDLADVLLLE